MAHPFNVRCVCVCGGALSAVDGGGGGAEVTRIVCSYHAMMLALAISRICANQVYLSFMPLRRARQTVINIYMHIVFMYSGIFWYIRVLYTQVRLTFTLPMGTAHNTHTHTQQHLIYSQSKYK